MTTSRCNNGDEYRSLTRSQLQIWAGQRLQPDEPLYNMALSFEIGGSIDPERFGRAFQAVVDRCDSLRTTFLLQDGAPKQCFHYRFRYDVPLVDLSTEDDPRSAALAWQRDRAKRLLDIEKCPYESVLLKLADTCYVWFLNQHHLVTDAWSTSLIYKAVAENYTLDTGSSGDTLPALPDYRDYVAYEDKGRHSKHADSAQEYWQARLAEAVPPVQFYRATPNDRGAQTVRMPCLLGSDRTGRIRKLAASGPFQAITADLAQFQFFATAMFAWLYRVSGNEVISIGTPSHNRASTALKQTVGMLIEIMPLNVEVDPEDTFASLYAKVAQYSQEMMLNTVPGVSSFENSRSYQVILNYITASFGAFDKLPMTSNWIHADHGDRNHLLRLQVENFDRADEFRLFFDLNTDTFGVAERERPANQFLRIVDSFLADPDTRIADIDLLDAQERNCLLARAKCPEPAPLPELTVIDMIAAQALKTPDAIAVNSGAQSLTYQQLTERVDRLACALACGSDCAGQAFAILLPRSIDAVVAILAVLRVRGTYIPIDPAYPQARIEQILEDAGVRVVIASGDIAATQLAGAQVIKPDAVAGKPVSLPATPGLNDAAYVIYTSGSTGQPKGVRIRHASLANYISWAALRYANQPGLSWALFSSLSFDLTVTTLFVPLASGGRIVVYPDKGSPGDIPIRQVIEDNAVDVIKLTPSHLALIQPMDFSASRLKKLIVGGEDFQPNLANSISKYFGDAIEIYNEYGPTEATVACMIHRFDPDTDTGSSVPVGKPIANAEIYILGELQQLQPDGVVGEIVIGGACVAEGYLGQVQLSRERFISNPLSPDELLYRTGDLGRWNEDHVLFCLGRCDEQLKINAVRIEPAEIEAALLKHGAISQSAAKMFVRSPAADEIEDRFCIRCGLAGQHPSAKLDGEDVCSICRIYESEREQALSYFRTLDDLRKIIDEAKSSTAGKQNCIMLLSGGKDSSYALCQLVDLGLTPLVFTLDNGFVSDGAKANMERVVGMLGLELVVGKTPAMNEIFADSLSRFSNVCNGCFKTIYTLSMNLARERGIKYICTGLSRGQIFETRVADLFQQRIFDPDRIDATIIEARKAYHRADDAVTRNLDVKIFADDSIFDEIAFVDFYRYTDVSLDEMLGYLKSRVPWVRPADTGRSTNCLINEAGIHVHKTERGYHNYSLPYSWDVRLGHKERDAARQELDDQINPDNVQRILRDVGYTVREPQTIGNDRILVAYYVSEVEIAVDELRAVLQEWLPREVIPGHFAHLPGLPLTSNGKVDRAALPDPDLLRPELNEGYVGPSGTIQTALAEVWASVLGIDRVGVNDNFFDLGGDSIHNIQIVVQAKQRGIALSPQQLFQQPTIAALAKVVRSVSHVLDEQGPVTGFVALTPIQRRFFENDGGSLGLYCQAITLESAGKAERLVMVESLRHIIRQHDMLRAHFSCDGKEWQQSIAPGDNIDVALDYLDVAFCEPADADRQVSEYKERLHREINLYEGGMVKCLLVDRGAARGSLLYILVHQLLVDAVSWWVILADLNSVYQTLCQGEPVQLPRKTASFKRWAEHLCQFAQSPAALASLQHWRQVTGADQQPLPRDLHNGNNDVASSATTCISLNRSDTRSMLVDIAAKWHTQVPDMLAAALFQTISAWSGNNRLVVDMGGRGREDVGEELDVVRTVGWFTNLYPVAFESVVNGQDWGSSLEMIMRARAGIPHGGISYGVLRYLNDKVGREFEHATPPEVLLNYLGQWNTNADDTRLFSLAEPLELVRDPASPRQHLFEINAWVFDGRLQVDWTYSQHRHRDTTVKALADDFMKNLLDLVRYCRDSEASLLAKPGSVAANISQDDVDSIYAEFGE